MAYFILTIVAPKGEELIESLTSAVRAVFQKMALEKISPKVTLSYFIVKIQKVTMHPVVATTKHLLGHQVGQVGKNFK